MWYKTFIVIHNLTHYWCFQSYHHQVIFAILTKHCLHVSQITLSWSQISRICNVEDITENQTFMLARHKKVVPDQWKRLFCQLAQNTYSLSLGPSVLLGPLTHFNPKLFYLLISLECLSGYCLSNMFETKSCFLAKLDAFHPDPKIINMMSNHMGKKNITSFWLISIVLGI